MPRNTPHWNLTETAAWVVFRNLSVVKYFSYPQEQKMIENELTNQNKIN